MHYFRSDLLEKKVPFIDVPVKDIMMCLNESPLDPYQTIKNSFLDKMESIRLNRYFSNVTQNLYQELANYVGFNIEPENILFGNGADQMLYSVFLSTRENNDSFALSIAPSYFDYKTYCNAVGMDIKFLSLNEKFDFDADEYLSLSKNQNCKLAIICNPNNPTGNLFDKEKILYILDNIEDIPVLIDETYFEFSGITFAHLFNKYPNLIIVRSFSKSFSSAGLRFGYLISSQKNCNEIKKCMTIFHSSILVQTFVLTILEYKQLFLDFTNSIIKKRESMFHLLDSFSMLTVKPSNTNFLIFSAGEQSPELFKHISDQNIAIRDVGSHPVLKNYLRVTVSSDNDNQKFINSIQSYYSK